MATTAPFEGFRAGQRATAIPVQFFTEVLPAIEDADELRVTLYALYALGRPGKQAALRVTALAAEAPLARAMGDSGRDVAAAVRTAAEAAAARGVLLLLPLEDGDAVVFVNNDGGRRLRDRVAAGSEAVPGARVSPRAVLVESSAPAAVYEQEVGLLTPSVGAALAEAEQRYPAGWIVDALREAARQNKRSWSYAEAILRRWQAEGRSDEATAGHPGRPADPYAHLYRRD